MPDTCKFCGGPDALYLKKDRKGEWADACYACCAPKAKREEPAAEDLTYLDVETTTSNTQQPKLF